MKKLRIDVATVLVLAAGTATAGGVWNYASCYTNADGSGSCSGTFKGFRDQSYEKSSAYFSESSDGSRYFAASTMDSAGNYSYGYCVPDATVSALWPKAMTFNGYFYIQFNAAGVCTSLNLVNGSPYYPGPEASYP